MPNPPERRRFLVLDVMIFVFAVAGGLSQARIYARELTERTNAARAGAVRAIEVATLSIVAAEPVAELLAIALIVVRLIPPRPDVRDLAHQPGLMACCNVVLALVLGSIWSYALRTHRMANVFMLAGGRFNPEGLELLAVPAMMRGAAVAAGWFSLALAGALRMERGWVESIGIAIGLYFIALIPIWGRILIG